MAPFLSVLAVSALAILGVSAIPVDSDYPSSTVSAISSVQATSTATHTKHHEHTKHPKPTGTGWPHRYGGGQGEHTGSEWHHMPHKTRTDSAHPEHTHTHSWKPHHGHTSVTASSSMTDTTATPQPTPSTTKTGTAKRDEDGPIDNGVFVGPGEISDEEFAHLSIAMGRPPAPTTVPK